MNPRHDQADGKRLELKFLWHWQRALLRVAYSSTWCPGYLGVPGERSRRSSNLSTTASQAGDDAFKRVVVRRQTGDTLVPLVACRVATSPGLCRYRTKGTTQLYLTGRDPEVLVAEAGPKAAGGARGTC